MRQTKFKMFSKPLSFNGRIGRLEYFISFVVFWVFAIGLTILANQENFNFLSLIKIIVSYFFVAQGAKRCHDIGRSGWFQIIPFFFIWMLIAKGQDGSNEYDNVFDEEHIIENNTKSVNPLMNLLLGLLGILLLFFAVACVFRFIDIGTRTSLIYGGFVLGIILLPSSISNNKLRTEKKELNQGSLKHDNEKKLTASELIEKYKSK